MKVQKTKIFKYNGIHYVITALLGSPSRELSVKISDRMPGYILVCFGIWIQKYWILTLELN